MRYVMRVRFTVREAKVRKTVVVTLFVLFVAMVASAGTVNINFDDLVGLGVVPDGYGGINWLGNWNYYGDPPNHPITRKHRRTGFTIWRRSRETHSTS